jgi:uncharacterized UPF0160 family protein
MKLVTHDDRFHADDVFTMATFRILLGDKITAVVRTRDEAIIQTADIVFDVGNVYDPETNRFDHHQTEGAGTRENGVPYASFGIVWKKYGAEICGSQQVANFVDEKLILPIDASDNGFKLYDYHIEGVREYVMDAICGSFGATWKEEDNFDTAFFEVVDLAEKILRREIVVARHKADAIPLVEKAYDTAEDKRIIIMDGPYPWKSVLEKHDDVLFAVSPSKDGTQWRVNAMQSAVFVNRKDFPKEWAGLRDEELASVSGVPDAKFCHRKLFLAVARSREGAISLAKMAANA